MDPITYHEYENELHALLFTFVYYLLAFNILVCQSEVQQLIAPIIYNATINNNSRQSIYILGICHLQQRPFTKW
jgi:hypothetical protein